MANRRWMAAMLGAAAMAMSAGASAQQVETGWYVGASLGNAEFASEDDTAWKLSAGYLVNRNFALEVGYTDLGEISMGGITAESSALEFLAVAKVPFANRFSAYGLLGLVRGETELSGAISGSDRSTDATYGLGAQYDFTQQLGVRAQWQRYDADDEIDVWSVGVVLRF